MQACKTGLHFKVVKFDHFEIGIMNLLPCSMKLNRVPIA